MLVIGAALGLALTGPVLAQTAAAPRNDVKAATPQKAVKSSRLDIRPERANLTSYTTKVSTRQQPVYIYQAPRAVKPLKTW